MLRELQDRCKGCMLGLAAGDALGMPVEGFSADQIKERFGLVRDMMPAPPGHFQFGLGSGQFTDDTLQTLLLAECILEGKCFDILRFTASLMDWGQCWTSDPRSGRGVGLTSRGAIEQLLANKDWTVSGVDIPTCGSAMRVAPIGLVYHCDLDLVSKFAEMQSIPTHSCSAARAGAVAVAVGVALALTGFSKSIVLEMASSFSMRIDSEFGRCLKRIGELLDLEPAEAFREIGTKPLVNETVPAAFYCYLKFDPEDALIMAASAGGDTDSIAAIAGALAGAAYGTKWLPERWLSCLEDRSRIERVAVDLAELGAGVCKHKI